MKIRFLVPLLVLLGCGIQDDGRMESYSSEDVSVFGVLQNDGEDLFFSEQLQILPPGTPIRLDKESPVQWHQDDEIPLYSGSYQGQEFWFSAHYITPGSVLGAVLLGDPVSIRASMDPAAPRVDRLEGGQIITILPQTEEESQLELVRIATSEPNVSSEQVRFFGTWNTWYIPRRALSMDPADVNFLQKLEESLSLAPNEQLLALKTLFQEDSNRRFGELAEEQIQSLERRLRDPEPSPPPVPGGERNSPIPPPPPDGEGRILEDSNQAEGENLPPPVVPDGWNMDPGPPPPPPILPGR